VRPYDEGKVQNSSSFLLSFYDKIKFNSNLLCRLNGAHGCQYYAHSLVSPTPEAARTQNKCSVVSCKKEETHLKLKLNGNAAAEFLFIVDF
jgi:hypothetical protein